MCLHSSRAVAAPRPAARARRRARAARVALLTIVIASASTIAGCSSNEGRSRDLGSSPGGSVGSALPAGTDESEPYEPPVILAVSAALGAEPEDIYGAVLSGRRTAAEEGITASGWSISQAELDDLYDPGPNDGGTITAYIDQLIAEFSQPERATTNSTTPTDRLRVDRIVSCLDEAEATYPNPNTMVLTAIEDFDAAVSAKVAGDERVADARQRRDDCAATHGLPAQAAQDTLGALSQRIADVQMAAFEGGSEARATASTTFDHFATRQSMWRPATWLTTVPSSRW